MEMTKEGEKQREIDRGREREEKVASIMANADNAVRSGWLSDARGLNLKPTAT